jgi:hypothetical protein
MPSERYKTHMALFRTRARLAGVPADLVAVMSHKDLVIAFRMWESPSNEYSRKYWEAYWRRLYKDRL